MFQIMIFAESNSTRSIRQSPMYWKHKRVDEIAIMSQIGAPPTKIFVKQKIQRF